LVVKGKPIGVLNVDKSVPNAYGDVEGRAVAAFANQAAVAIENARLYEETRQRANELEIVHQVSSAIATVVDIDRLIEQTTEFIASRIYPDVFGFVLLDPATGLFMPHSSYHGLPPGGTETSVPLQESVTGRVVQTGEAVLVPDVRQEPLYFSIVSETRSEIAVPLHCNGQVIGAINVESRESNAFSEADMRFLKTLAGQVATAIERAQLYENLEEQAADLAEEVRDRTAELQWERDRMLTILESAGEGILFTDCDETILYINPAMERQTGYSREECLGKTPRIWRSEKTPEAVIKEMWETTLRGQRWQGEIISRRKDGSTFDASVTVTPLYDSAGELTGYVSVQADISRLKEVDRLKSKFIANVSHELRTPLTNIRMYVSLLERGKMARWEHYLAVIQQETDRLTRLIQDLLDLSRLEARAPQPELGPIDVALLVEEVVHLFQARAERKRITMMRQIESDLPPVLAEKSELQQVLNNLVANALAYTPPDGTVKIEAKLDELNGDEVIRLRVSDNGPGIGEEEHSRLFERFYRGSAALRGKEPGTGLGLSICKEIIDNYGGTIEAGASEDGGAQFTVWWPTGAA
jgi:PAS domain S-box-containing protein